MLKNRIFFSGLLLIGTVLSVLYVIILSSELEAISLQMEQLRHQSRKEITALKLEIYRICRTPEDD